MSRFLFLAAVVAYFAVFSGARPPYQKKIPNGNNIPDPCLSGNIWQGVGHQNISGGGPRNKFGEDFQAANYEWTLELCLKDSDGDGKPNGIEVGDPGCKWVEGATPTITDRSQLSHPGVCEPVGSSSCKAVGSFLSECPPHSG